MSTTWANWAGNVQTHPRAIERPALTAEVQALVKRALHENIPLKAYGARHSFTSIAATDGIAVSLDRMNHLLTLDRKTGHVRVQAGISLHELNPQLRTLGYALPNLGDVDPQSIAGAISTGTHGTGGKLKGIASAIVGMQLVTGTGDVVEIDSDDPLLKAAAVGLGALGIVTEVTLACVPKFLLHAVEEPAELPAILENLDALADDNDHAEFYWFPHTEKALLKRNNRVPEFTPKSPLSKTRYWWDDEFLSNTVYERVQQIGRKKSAWIPKMNEISGSLLGAREYTAESFEVFISPRRVKFCESEFAVPREALVDVINELQTWYTKREDLISFPIEVRFAASDDLWLSTGYERENAYVAVHQYFKADPTKYFAAAQDIFTAHEGRPHWGKMHTLGADYFAQQYPKFGHFVKLRGELDPKRVFQNEYLERVLER